MRKVPVEKVKEFETELISYMRNKHSAELENLRTGKLTDEATQAIEKAAEVSASTHKHKTERSWPVSRN